MLQLVKCRKWNCQHNSSKEECLTDGYCTLEVIVIDCTGDCMESDSDTED